jgi:hypothetical protein
MSRVHALMPDALSTACDAPIAIIGKRPNYYRHTATHRLDAVTCGDCKKRLQRFPQLSNLIRAKAREDGLELAPLTTPPPAPKPNPKKPKPEAPAGPLFGFAGAAAPEPESERPALELVTDGCQGVFVECSRNNSLRRRIAEAREADERRHTLRMQKMAERLG